METIFKKPWVSMPMDKKTGGWNEGRSDWFGLCDRNRTIIEARGGGRRNVAVPASPVPPLPLCASYRFRVPRRNTRCPTAAILRLGRDSKPRRADAADRLGPPNFPLPDQSVRL